MVDFSGKFKAGGKEGEAMFGEENIPGEKLIFRDKFIFQEFVTLFESFFVARKIASIAGVELGENVVKIGAAATGRIMDKIEVGRFEKDHGVARFLGEAAGFTVGSDEGFSFAVVGRGDSFARLIDEFDAVKIGAAL